MADVQPPPSSPPSDGLGAFVDEVDDVADALLVVLSGRDIGVILAALLLANIRAGKIAGYSRVQIGKVLGDALDQEFGAADQGPTQ